TGLQNSLCHFAHQPCPTSVISLSGIKGHPSPLQSPVHHEPSHPSSGPRRSGDCLRLLQSAIRRLWMWRWRRGRGEEEDADAGSRPEVCSNSTEILPSTRISARSSVSRCGRMPRFPPMSPSIRPMTPTSSSKAAAPVVDSLPPARPVATTTSTTRIFSRRCSLEPTSALSIPSPRCTSALPRAVTTPLAASPEESTRPLLATSASCSAIRSPTSSPPSTTRTLLASESSTR
ncbi:hypothetical protein PENTCL1PPCAC_30373, partial [Pristionchus entomophagus]